MSRPTYQISNGRPTRKGLGLFELLISLSITAVLLTATGVALDASFKAYRANQEIGDLTQRARLAMHRILTEVRSASDHQPSSDTLSIYQSGIAVESKFLRIQLDDNTRVDYYYENGKLMRLLATRPNISSSWASDTPRVFLDGLTESEFSFTLEPQRSLNSARAGLPYDQLRRATIRMTVRDSATSATSTESAGKQAVTLVSSVVPRRNAW